MLSRVAVTGCFAVALMVLEVKNHKDLQTSDLAGLASRWYCSAFCIDTACRVLARAILYSLPCLFGEPSCF